MGLHDYICLAQKNSQNVLSIDPFEEPLSSYQEYLELEQESEDWVETVLESTYEYNRCGGQDVILVRVPRSQLTRDQIKQLPYVAFRDFPSSPEKHEWDCWNFTSLSASEQEAYERWRHVQDDEHDWAIWPINEEQWGVVFEPLAYDLFVKEMLEAERVPLQYYVTCLNNRDIHDIKERFPDLDKRQMFEYLRDDR